MGYSFAGWLPLGRDPAKEYPIGFSRRIRDQFQLSRRATGSRRCLYRVGGAAPFAAAAATCIALCVRKRRALDNGGETLLLPAIEGGRRQSTIQKDQGQCYL